MSDQQSKQFSQGGFQETSPSNQGFQPPATDKGFQPQPADQGFQPQPTDQGFQPPVSNTGFNPVQSKIPEMGQSGFQEVVNMKAIEAFAKGSADAVPVGYEQGYKRGLAGDSRQDFSQLGFIDTNQTVEYGKGYAFGWAQGFSAGYSQGVLKRTNA